jgi:hypothetical protein
MNIRKIKFPNDFSHHNNASRRLASRLAAKSSATIHIVHVFDAQVLSAALGEAVHLYPSAWQDECEIAKQNLANGVSTVSGVACQKDARSRKYLTMLERTTSI